MINTLMMTEGVIVGTFDDVTVKLIADDERRPHIHLYWTSGKGVVSLENISAPFSHSVFKDCLPESKFIKFKEWLKSQNKLVKNCTNYGYVVSVWGMINNTLYYGNIDNTIPLYWE